MQGNGINYLDGGNISAFNFGASQDFSCEFWVKHTGGTGTTRLVGKRNSSAAGWNFNILIARISEIKASSRVSFDDAIKSGLARASKTLDNVRSAWISIQEVMVNNKADITEYLVLMKVTFVLKD